MSWPRDMVAVELDWLEVGERVLLRWEDVKAWRKVKR